MTERARQRENSKKKARKGSKNQVKCLHLK